MSLFKVSKTDSEINPSPFQMIQNNQIEEENNSNHQYDILLDNSQKNNLRIPFCGNYFSINSHSCKEINIFYSKIKYIRKKYNINKSRKNHIDSLVKKAKSKFLKAIYESLKYCLHSCNLNRLPQNFIINTRIEYNKKVFNKTVEELYTEFKLLPSYETLLQNNLIYQNKKEFLYFLMKSKLKDIYKYYISSDLYKLDKQRIESKSGEGIAKLYDFVATNICEYFLLNKGNHRRFNIKNNKSNENKLNIKKKRFLIKKKFSKSINNNNVNNINKNENIKIKFNIIKFDDNSIFKNESEKIGIIYK